MGECSEVSVMVGACDSVGMVNLLKNGRCVASTWPAVQSLVEKVLHDPGTAGLRTACGAARGTGHHHRRTNIRILYVYT